jgi:hypothetical protein
MSSESNPPEASAANFNPETNVEPTSADNGSGDASLPAALQEEQQSIMAAEQHDDNNNVVPAGGGGGANAPSSNNNNNHDAPSSYLSILLSQANISAATGGGGGVAHHHTRSSMLALLWNCVEPIVTAAGKRSRGSSTTDNIMFAGDQLLPPTVADTTAGYLNPHVAARFLATVANNIHCLEDGILRDGYTAAAAAASVDGGGVMMGGVENVEQPGSQLGGVGLVVDIVSVCWFVHVVMFVVMSVR